MRRLPVRSHDDLLGDLAQVGGGCYLLHFSPRYGHAGHYLGYADDLLRRVGEHLMGRSGVKLTTLARASGCRLLLARLWPDATRDDERRMKGSRAYPLNPQHHGGLARRCPICRNAARQVAQENM